MKKIDIYMKAVAEYGDKGIDIADKVIAHLQRQKAQTTVKELPVESVKPETKIVKRKPAEENRYERWDEESAVKAQTLLDQGVSPREVGRLCGRSEASIRTAIFKGLLKNKFADPKRVAKGALGAKARWGNSDANKDAH